MTVLRTEEGALSTLALTIVATVGSSILLGILYAAFAVWSDVQTIKAQQVFYHGPWPPVHTAGMPP